MGGSIPIDMDVATNSMANETKHASDTSSYERQLSKGFPNLQFERRLEIEFRLDWLQRHLRALRVGAVIGMLLIGALSILDFLFLPAPFNKFSAILRLTLMFPAFLVFLLGLYYLPTMRFVPVIGMFAGLLIGLTSLLMGFLADKNEIQGLFNVYLVITFFIYFGLSMRFRAALLVGFTLFFGFILEQALLGGDVIAASYNGLFLLFGNFLGASVLYSLEHSERCSFLEEKVLNNHADRDGLTGMHNRRFFANHLKSAWQQMEIAQLPIALIFADVDYFKKFNDLYGHQAGDKCLTTVAGMFSRAARRPMDIAARYGGEEFVVLLCGPSKKYIIDTAEKIRADIEALKIPHKDSAAAEVVTLSLGVAFLFPHEGLRSQAGLVQLADESMYQAKQHGRNRVVVADVHDKTGRTGIFRRPAIKVGKSS